MANIILFGGHGRIALLTEPLLAQRGDRVTAVIRDEAQSGEVQHAGADPLVADIEQLDTPELAKLIAGHDAVVWSAGAGGGNPQRTIAVDRDAAIRSMDAASAAGVKRYLMVSYFGSSLAHGVDPQHPFFTYAEAKAAADAHLRETGLDWTILGPSALTFDPGTGLIDTGTEHGNGTEPETDTSEATSVSRENVALTIAAALADDSTIRRTITFNDGDTSIAEAIRR